MRAGALTPAPRSPPSTSLDPMADREREDRERRRAAVERELSRLRAADDPDADSGKDDQDLLDAVTEEQRQRDAANADRPS